MRSCSIRPDAATTCTSATRFGKSRTGSICHSPQRSERHMITTMRRMALTSLVAGVFAGGCSRPAAPKPIVEVRTPDPDVGVAALDARRTAQLENASQFGVQHDFAFTDRLKD